MDYVLPSRSITLASLAERRLPVFVTMNESAFRPDLVVKVEITMAGEHPQTVPIEAPFLGPPP